ncbi:MAG: protein-export chaperone SecB [Acetobacter sp.]|nr:protein-export chaperone SecB [Acetobacter sp.]
MTQTNATPELAITMQYIKDMSLEIPHAPQIFNKLSTQPKLNIDLNIDANKVAENQYEVTLNLRINADIENDKLFIFELSYAAACIANLPEEALEGALYIEIPTLLFPYARQIISSNLAEAGMPPLMLAPINFAEVYKNKKEQSTKIN